MSQSVDLDKVIFI